MGDSLPRPAFDLLHQLARVGWLWEQCDRSTEDDQQNQVSEQLA
jgi:hypothetical protein